MSDEEREKLNRELEAAFHNASENAADPVAQKAFRQKFWQAWQWSREHAKPAEATRPPGYAPKPAKPEPPEEGLKAALVRKRVVPRA